MKKEMKLRELYTPEECFSLKDKNVVIFGGAGKMAESFSRALLFAGCKSLTLVDLKEDRLKKLIKELTGEFPARDIYSQTCSVSDAGQVVNVGSGQEISIGDLVKTIMRITGKKAEIECDDECLRPPKSEVNRLVCDASRAREWTGWAPKFSLEDGLIETSRWIKNNMKYFKPELYNI